MHRLIILAAFIIALSSPAFDRAEAQVAPTAAAGIVGTRVASEVFSDLRENLESVIAQAEAAGNRLIQNLAETALDLLDATETSAAKLIDQSFDRLDDSTRNAANEVNEVLNRIEAGQAVLMEDADRMSANMVGAMRSLPLVADLNEVYNFSPRVVSPSGADVIRIKVLGPGLGSSNAAATLDGTDLEIQRITTSEVQIVLPRSMLDFGPENSNFAAVNLSFDKDDGGFLSHPERIERELYLWLLPTGVAEWTLAQTVTRKSGERTNVKTFVDASGRDAGGGDWMNVRTDHYGRGWRLDVRKLGRWIDTCKKDKNKCSWHGFVHGRAMSCVGPDMNRADKRRVFYKMQFGHYMNGLHKRGGSGRCYLKLPIVRTVTSNESVQGTGQVTWAEDQILPLDPNVKNWTLTLKLYDNRVVKIGPRFSVPSMDIEVEKARDGILLRPARPRDF